MMIRLKLPNYRYRLLILGSFAVFLSAPAEAQMSAQKIQGLFDRIKSAVVKIKVEGTDPFDKLKKKEGSGFFIYSSQNRSFLLTARHVVGSSETQQPLNPDWKVENGQILRKIKIESLNDNGTLVLRSDDGLVAPTGLPSGVDMALLMVEQDGFPILPLAKRLTEKVPLHDVILLGFREGKSQLTRPIPSGTGSLVGFTYSTSIPSQPGESGGPWVDLKSGKVFALASVVKSSPSGASNEATPVTFIRPFLDSYFQSAGLKLDESATAFADAFKIIGSEGEARVSAFGDALTGGLKKEGSFGELVEVVGRGDEASQCDAGSGRTFSGATARGKVSPYDASGIRFEYLVAAQGGHFRRAATCLGNNPVGISGNDTKATASVDLDGTLSFVAGEEPIFINWDKMPTTGAKFKLVNETGKVVVNSEISKTGQYLLKNLSPGNYRLTTTVAVDLTNRGACCGLTEAYNGTLSLRTLAGP
jgi:Trypsin-like peptidase domain